jgi:hypothetical protein
MRIEKSSRAEARQLCAAWRCDFHPPENARIMREIQRNAVVKKLIGR